MLILREAPLIGSSQKPAECVGKDRAKDAGFAAIVKALKEAA